MVSKWRCGMARHDVTEQSQLPNLKSFSASPCHQPGTGLPRRATQSCSPSWPWGKLGSEAPTVRTDRAPKATAARAVVTQSSPQLGYLWLLNSTLQFGHGGWRVLTPLFWTRSRRAVSKSEARRNDTGTTLKKAT